MCKISSYESVANSLTPTSYYFLMSSLDFMVFPNEILEVTSMSGNNCITFLISLKL
jgi:hypothetical protein